MKRAILALLVLAPLTSGPALSQEGQQREVTIALQAPLDSHMGETIALFAETLEASEETDITVVIQASGDPYSDAEMRAAVAAGDVDLGLVSLNRFADDLPAVSVFYLPLRFSTLEELQVVTAKGHPVRDAIDATVADTGVTPLWWQSYGQIVLLSAGAPAKTPLSLDGNKVRVFGRDGQAFIEAAGAAVVRLPARDLPDAFASGALDYALVDLPSLASWSLWDHTASVTLGSFGSIEMVAIANPDFLASLSDAERALLDAAAAAAEEDARARIQALEGEALAAANENGLLLHKLGQEELATWEDLKLAMRARYLENAGGTGEWLLDAWKLKIEAEDSN